MSRPRVLTVAAAVVVCLLSIEGRAAAAPSRRATVSLSSSAVTGATQTVTVTEQPAVPGRQVAVWGRLRGTWSRLALTTEGRTGRAATSVRYPRSGTWTVRIRLYAHGGHRRTDLADRTVRSLPARPPVVLAHRGGAAEAPENTMAAFEHAVAEHVPVLEADVQSTSDGQLVCVHDLTLARTTDVATVFPGRQDDPVGTFTLAELRQLRVTVGPGPPTRLATFDDLVHLTVSSGVSLLAEAKHPQEGSPALAEAMLDEAGRDGLTSTRASTRLVIESYDVAGLRRVREDGSSANLSPILEQQPTDVAALASWADSLTVQLAGLDAAGVGRAHASGLEVNAWVADTEAQILDLADAGVDGVITDRPEAALVALR